MDNRKTDTNTICIRESGHDTRGSSQQRSPCDGHILVLCIVPYKWCWLGFNVREQRLTSESSHALPRVRSETESKVEVFMALFTRGRQGVDLRRPIIPLLEHTFNAPTRFEIDDANDVIHFGVAHE